MLHIGSGWGARALFLARQEGDEDRVAFHLHDCRQQRGVFERIVSSGMFEHAGVPHYPSFFAKLRDLLTDDGIDLLHTISRAIGPSATDPWIPRRVFPGDYAPALSEILKTIEKARLWVTDIEVLRLHYAETLHNWRHRFLVKH